MREQLGLTIRDVESATARLAGKYANPEFSVQLSRLSDIETKGVVPSVYRIYALAVIYRRDVREIMKWYGINVDSYAEDLEVVAPPNSQRLEGLGIAQEIRMPVKTDPLQLSNTANISRIIAKWGAVPLTFLRQFELSEYTYFYIGTDDLTMYPLLMPGSFVQVDEKQNKILSGPWPSEYERPIYFVELRTGFRCAWCELDGDRLILQPHPLSPQKTAIYKYPQEAEIVGRVVGIAMRLADWKPVPSAPRAKVTREHS